MSSSKLFSSSWPGPSSAGNKEHLGSRMEQALPQQLEHSRKTCFSGPQKRCNADRSTTRTSVGVCVDNSRSLLADCLADGQSVGASSISPPPCPGYGSTVFSRASYVVWVRPSLRLSCVVTGLHDRTGSNKIRAGCHGLGLSFSKYPAVIVQAAA